MNKSIFIFFLFSLILGVGCQGEQTAVSTIPVIAATETESGTAVSPIPETVATVKTAVSTPTLPATTTATPLPTATKTAVPTATSTTIPLPTPTPLPPPEGQIIFLWDSESPPAEYGGDPKQSLYIAEPGKSPSEWHIQPLLDNLYGFPVTALSPDQSKLALMVLEDRNNDGEISYDSFKRGGDAPNLYIYSLTNGSFERITDNYPNSFYLSWMPDSQIITYPDHSSLFSYNLMTQSIQKLSGDYPDGISKVAWSPDGEKLALDLNLGTLYFFDPKTEQNVEVPEDIASSPSNFIVWSPDSKWLASNTYYGAGLFIVSRETLESNVVITTDFASFPAWRPLKEASLAYTKIEFVGSSAKETILDLWNIETQTSTTLQESVKMSDILWDPDGKMLAVGLFNENLSQLALIEPETGTSYILLEKQDGTAAYVPLAWSPDEMWLLFFNKQEESTGLYIVHRDGGEPYLLLDTTNTYDPFAVSWLSGINSLNTEPSDE